MSEEAANDLRADGHVPWNKRKLTGGKHPFTLEQIWKIPIRLGSAGGVRDVAPCELGIVSKLRGFYLV